MIRLPKTAQVLPSIHVLYELQHFVTDRIDESCYIPGDTTKRLGAPSFMMFVLNTLASGMKAD